MRIYKTGPLTDATVDVDPFEKRMSGHTLSTNQIAFDLS